MKHLKKLNEYNTDFDDHKVNQNVNINNDKTFGAPTPTKLPVDYFGIPDEDGEIDEEDYYSTDAGRDGLYHGTEPGPNKGVKSRASAIYKMSAESINGYLSSQEEEIEKLTRSISRMMDSIDDNIYNINYKNISFDIKINSIDMITDLSKKVKSSLIEREELLKKLRTTKNFNL